MTEAEPLNQHAQLREAVAAAKLGHKVLARKLLAEITAADERHEEAWLWRAALADQPDEAHRCLVRVLDINPNNRHAMNALALQRLRDAAQRQRPAAPPIPQAASASPPAATAAALAPEPPPVVYQWHCPLCQAPSAEAPERCPRCGAVLDVARIDDLAANHDVAEDALLEAIQRHTRTLRTAPSADAHVHLALAFLNLNRSAEALPHLEKALELNAQDGRVRHALETLRARKLILAVDDSLTLRKIVSVTLERHGYRVLTAMDGMQALARLNEQTPDLVLLDITMPRMDGYQVCKTIKQNAYTKSIPVLMLSGKDGFFDKVKGKLAGATDYLTKPFQEESLLRAVEKYLKGRN